MERSQAIDFRKARPGDAKALAQVSKRAFHADVWNRRTRHFYQKVGFAEVGEDGHRGILFERQIADRSLHGYP